MSNAYSVTNNNTNAIKYTRHILQVCHESVERPDEFRCQISFKLGKMYWLHQIDLVKVKELFDKKQKKPLLLSTEIGDRNAREVSCYGNLEAVYQLVGEYNKAREHLEKSLAIQKTS